jgi:hypothetical protein
MEDLRHPGEGGVVADTQERTRFLAPNSTLPSFFVSPFVLSNPFLNLSMVPHIHTQHITVRGRWI